MINELIILMTDQEKELKQLLDLLETENQMLLDKDLFGLEGIVDKLNECSKRIAQKEVQRRKLLGNNSISEFVRNSDSDDLSDVYENIRNTVKSVLSQKESNEILLKQRILFNTKMMNIMNPSRPMATYNSYGKLSR